MYSRLFLKLLFSFIPKADFHCSLHLVGIITKKYAFVVQHIEGIVDGFHMCCGHVMHKRFRYLDWYRYVDCIQKKLFCYMISNYSSQVQVLVVSVCSAAVLMRIAGVIALSVFYTVEQYAS